MSLKQCGIWTHRGVIIVVQLFWREREADVPALSTFYEKLGSAWRKKDNILAAAPHYLVPVTMIDAYIHVCIQFFHNPKNLKIGWKLPQSTVFKKKYQKCLIFCERSELGLFPKNLWWIVFVPCKFFEILSVSGYLQCKIIWNNLKEFSRGKNELPKVSKVTLFIPIKVRIFRDF